MKDSSNFYTPTPQDIWQGRADTPPHERFFQHVELVNLNHTQSVEPKRCALIGFKTDIGVRRNLGRAGAASGPTCIRKHLANLATPESFSTFFDVGDIDTHENLEQSSAALSAKIEQSYNFAAHNILLGGGHEIAYPHFIGVSAKFPKAKIGIINFDAHFDLREPGAAGLTSGTPFRQIANHCQQHSRAFDYLCIGIQERANTQSLFSTAKTLGANYILAEHIHRDGYHSYLPTVNDFIAQHDLIYLSIDLDVFATNYAPGVSAPQPFGLSPMQILPLLRHILQTSDVVAIDIAECAPPLDSNDSTAKLAAHIVAECMIQLTSRSKSWPIRS